jgi:hypothetical protein
MTDATIGTETSVAPPAEARASRRQSKAERGSRAGKGGSKPKVVKTGSRKARRGPAKAGRTDTKQDKLVAMLRRPEGATVDEMAKAFGWQAHTVRGAIAGAIKKKLGLNVASEKDEKRGRIYRIAN